MTILTRLRAFLDSLIGLRLEIHGQSMEPTFKSGTRLVASRLPKRWARLRRGDVVVVKPPDQAELLELKRILGLPHEIVSWSGGGIRVNDRLLDEPYARIPAPPPGDDDMRSVQLDNGQYFVAGDNRLFSHDSRRYGPLPRQAIVGIVRPSPP